MPREIRKRGKKHKKVQRQVVLEHQIQEQQDYSHNHLAEPSWIVSARDAENIHPEAPFGYVEPDVKAYFHTINEQIRSWQENPVQPVDENGDLDPNETKRVFFVAALSEMSGKEKQLATDPDCSIILERMVHSMDDFVLRVLLDRLSGSFEILFKHRFASHVCQTILSVAIDTVSREARGIFPDIPASEVNGELRTLTQLVLDLCEEVRPSFNSLIMDPFASHVLRSLLLLLCPTVFPEDSARKSVRSKKSMSWKLKRGHMKSVFDKDKENHSLNGSVPGSFRRAANQLLQNLRDGLDANEVRALAANKVACPLLHLVLEIEVDYDGAFSPDSLMDRILVGMIKACHEGSTTSIEPSDYLLTLLRDPAASYLLETIVLRCPKQVFHILWSTYFKGKLARLALHPVANFVVAKAIERQNSKQLGDTLKELESTWSKLIKFSRTGVLRALIDRSRSLGTHQKDVCEAVFTSIEISSLNDRNNLVPCLLLLKSLEDYQAIPVLTARLETDHKEYGGKGQADGQREPKIQGALLLESLLRLDEPHCSIVVDSISSLSMEDLIRIAHNASSSHVIDALLESSTVSFKAKRQFVMSLIGHYHSLVNDPIGSRIGDRCWAFADPYLREKIARSLIPFGQFLAGSFYGKFFVRKLNLHLLQRRPEEWRTLQSDDRTASATSAQPSICSPIPRQPTPPVVSTTSQKSLKRRDMSEDVIDSVFNAALGKKTRKTVVKRVAAIHDAQQLADQQLIVDAIFKALSENGCTKKRRVD